MAKRYKPEDIKLILQELAGENDRAKAIVGHSLLEYGLDRALESRLVPLTEADTNALFSDRGPFGSYSVKVMVAFAVGLFGPETKRDLELVGKIRNDFAHNVNPRSFDDSEIANRCRELKIVENSDAHLSENWRQKYVLTVQVLMGLLIAEAVENKPQIPPPKHLTR